MRRLTAPLVRCALILGLLLTAVGCGGPQPPRVTIMVPWSGAEFTAFHSVIEAFEHDTGVEVDVQVTRALTQQLDASVAAGAPPDLAMLPSVGAIDTYVKAGLLKPLDVGTDSFVQPFRELAMEDGEVYAVPVKADVKSLVWYNPGVTDRPPATWPALLDLDASWCLGLESGPTSGWPGADWIADILLAEQGSDTYKRWLSGEEKWDSAPVRRAWTTWRTLVGDSAEGASTRRYGEASKGMTDPPHTCSLGHGALSAMAFPTRLEPKTGYDSVTPSPDRRVQVSADFVGMFTDENASARDLISYLSSEEAQQDWVGRPASYALSANKQVTTYGNAAQRETARMLQPGSGYTLCFSAADAMDTDVSAAFYRAVLTYARDGKGLTDLLRSLDRVQSVMGSSPLADELCSTP